MQNRTDKYTFTLDTFNHSMCSGWYSRYDSEDNSIILERNANILVFKPAAPRPDVAAAGKGGAECGFYLKFNPPLRDGEIVRFKDASGALLWAERMWANERCGDVLNEKLAPLVEPFVELDIRKVQARLMADSIAKQYREAFRGNLAFKDDFQLREELSDILADIKTTLHLLSAAYLDYTRYKDPEFLKSIPKKQSAPRRKLVVDMKGDITGSNWHEAEEKGRWAGPGERSTLLLPSLEPGSYRLVLEISGEIAPGAKNNIILLFNDERVELEEDMNPNMLCARVALESDEAPFIALTFIYGGQMLSPSEINLQSDDTRKISFMLKSLSFERTPEK